MSVSCVRVEHLSKSFSVPDRKSTILKVLTSLQRGEPLHRTLKVLNDFSFEIKKGEKVAIIGKNGSGKTTLMRLLAGIYEPTSGEIQVNATPRMIFKASFGLNPDISILDNVYLLGAMHGFDRSDMKSRVERILTTAGLGQLRYSIAKNLSIGQAQRLALSAFFEAEGDLFLLDEAMGSVDNDFVKTCDEYFSRLMRPDKTLVMTSHQSATLRKYCTKALWIEHGAIRMHGDFNEVMAQYEKV